MNQPQTVTAEAKIPVDTAARAAVLLFKEQHNFEETLHILIRCSTRPRVAAQRTIGALVEHLCSLRPSSRNHTRGVTTVIGLSRAYGVGDKALAAEVVRHMEIGGFYRDFPEMTKALLGRNPTDTEIVVLTRCYCDDTNSRNESDEHLLRSYAILYCSPIIRQNVLMMLEASAAQFSDMEQA